MNCISTRVSLLIFTLTFSLTLFAQSLFEAPKDIMLQSTVPHAMVSFDVNGDGDQDVICSYPYFHLVYYENEGDHFSPARDIDFAPTKRALVGADADGDGDIDLFADDFWYENTGGTFAPPQSIPIGHIVLTMAIRDLDNDGDLDYVSSGTSNTIAWCENLGGGVFAPGVIVDAAALGVNKVAVADIDNDGDLDLLGSNKQDKAINWYENTGGAFGPAILISTAVGGWEGPQDVEAADLDGDGDEDILVAGPSLNKIFWYRNLGGGTFSGRLTLADGIATTEISTGDPDNDGDIDVLTKFSIDILVYENDGTGNFAGDQVLYDGTRVVSRYLMSDFDGDSQLDLLIGDVVRTIQWSKSMGGLSFSSGNLIDFSLGSVISSKLVDVDNDGDLDFVGVGSISYGILENRGADKVTVKQRYFLAYPITPDEITWCDIDADGDNDLMVSSFSGDRVYISENDGTGLFAEPVELLSGVPLVGGTVTRYGDINSDGLPDILVTAIDELIWYENLGGSNFGPANSLPSPGNLFSEAYLVDLDGDGDVDIAAVNENELALFENLGGTFGPLQTINVFGFSYGSDMHYNDMDADGDIDLIVTKPYAQKVSWYKNFGGLSFSAEQIIDAGTGLKIGVYTDDLTGNGFPDVIVSDDNKLIWYENFGGGSFSSEQLISTEYDFVTEIQTGDIDGDGDVDVAISNIGSVPIAWSENTTASPCASPPVGLTHLIGPGFLTLSWNETTEAFGYLVNIERFVGGSSAGSKTFVEASTSRTLNFTVPEGTYKWRVRAGCPMDTTEWSELATFVVPTARHENANAAEGEEVNSALSGPEGILSIFPNPAAEVVNFNLPAAEGFTLEISDLSGKMVYQQTHSSSTAVIDVSKWSNGLYYFNAVKQLSDGASINFGGSFFKE